MGLVVLETDWMKVGPSKLSQIDLAGYLEVQEYAWNKEGHPELSREDLSVWETMSNDSKWVG